MQLQPKPNNKAMVITTMTDTCPTCFMCIPEALSQLESPPRQANYSDLGIFVKSPAEQSPPEPSPPWHLVITAAVHKMADRYPTVGH